MDLLGNFFTLDSTAAAIAYDYSPGLVLVSILTAMLGSALAIYLTEILSRADSSLTRIAVRLSGALAFGGAVWSMHFFGMLAFALCVRVTYDPWMTLISVIPAVVSAWIAIGWMAKPRLSVAALFWSCILIGGGIALMHYSGMMAMQMTALLRFDPGGFLISVVAALVLSALSLLAIDRIRRKVDGQPWKLWLTGGVGFGLAISTMHYMGMAAARFMGEAETSVPVPPQDQLYLASVVVMGLLALLGNVFSGGLLVKVSQSLRKVDEQRRDIETSHAQLKRQQAVMLKTEKLATLGTLSAGIAHEINNPLAFVTGNLATLDDYVHSLLKFVDLVKTWGADGRLSAEQLAEFDVLIRRTDLEFMLDDLDDLLRDTIDGSQRITEIVRNLRSFSRTERNDRVSADLNEGINSTLRLLRSKIGEHQRVELDLQPLPAVICNPNEVNQVFLNLIINAIQAIDQDGCIRISSAPQEGQVVIRIADDGAGMSDEIQKQIFDPFYTTKPPGQGTGMGLAIAHGIIEDHRGSIQVFSKPGEGTCFQISLPAVADNQPQQGDSIG